MAEPKTRPTDASVEEFFDRIDDEERRADCRAIAAMMKKATGRKPVMWGDAIVGFGRYELAYANGTTADWPIIGFSPRKGDMTLYLMNDAKGLAALLPKLGKHKTSKACLYIKRLRDIDTKVLDEMIRLSVEGMKPKRVD